MSDCINSGHRDWGLLAMAVTERLSNVKIWVRLLFFIWLMLCLAWSGMILLAMNEQRSISVQQAIGFGETMNEMTMAGLTTLMITGTMAQRDEFLSQIKELNEVSDLHVLRGEAVSRQFGAGLAHALANDDIERKVLETGQAYIEVESDGRHVRAVIPNLNRSDYLGKNCMMCHAAAAEGEVLGAVSMRISLAAVNDSVLSFGWWLFGIAILISLPLLGVVYWFIRRFVTVPLRAMTAGLQDIAGGGGDLTRRLEVRGGDEIGQASMAFNDMMSKVHQLIRKIVASSEQLAQASEKVSLVSDATNRDVTEQRAEIQQLAAAMNQMAATAQDVAHNAQHAAEAAEAGDSAASRGSEVVTRTAESIGHLAVEVQAAADVIRKLAADSAQIGSVLQLIREIAEQTNLLALNAAIEAARAGEQGRGFAVVADEVRSLATRTHKSTQQIEDMLEKLKGDTQNAMSVMEKGHDQAETTVEQAGEAGQALDAISGAVNTITSVNMQIASAAEEQSAVAEEVSRNITAISAVAEKSAEGARESAEAGDQLARLANELRKLVGEFKV